MAFVKYFKINFILPHTKKPINGDFPVHRLYVCILLAIFA